MIETYTVTQLAELEGVNRMTISRRVHAHDPRYIPLAVRVNTRSKEGYTTVYALASDIHKLQADHLAVNKE